jgi:phosphoribosylpyrophosphate synthetase
VNHLRGSHVLFLASFSGNDATLSQFYALIVLLESFIESLTVVLPYYPTATMERVVNEGTIATASTMARLFNSLPSCGRPTCLLIYDIHTLQNRFYLSGNCLA